MSPARPRVADRRPALELDGGEMMEAMQEPTLVCAKCGGPGDGWKCAICGSVAQEHDSGHLHGGSDRYCTVRCARCEQADVLCTCV